MDLLRDIRATIRHWYPSLVTIDGYAGKKFGDFIHLWKPHLSEDDCGVDGIGCLPSFHAMIRADEDGDVTASLYSFHGKLLCEESRRDSNNSNGYFKLIEDLDKGNIQLCQGVQDLKTANLELFMRTCKQPLYEKIKSLFLIEHAFHSLDTVVRSRLCSYFAYKDKSDGQDFPRCEE